VKINFSEKSFLPKNHGSRWSSLMQKIGGKKSRRAIPLNPAAAESGGPSNQSSGEGTNRVL
jgi:hypothetical protein